MTDHINFSRRRFLQAITVGLGVVSPLATGLWLALGKHPANGASAGNTATSASLPDPAVPAQSLLAEIDYGRVRLGDSPLKRQFASTIDTLMQISEDSMLKPYRERAGLPAPGADIGGWYDNYEGYDWQSADWRGFAPGHCFGQWLSALCRAYAVTGSPELKNRTDSLVRGYSQTISPKFYQNFRFPAYTYDKLLRGLLDAYLLTGNQDAWTALQRTTDVALPFLPNRPVDREGPPPGKDVSWTWDEPYTLPENQFLTYLQGGGERYLEVAKRLLIDQQMFTPLSQGQNALAGKHAYSHFNALSSAVQAYLVLGSNEHLKAAENGFDIVSAQSFATGGWGPQELFIEIGSGNLGESLDSTHASFETPCGSYAHLKLARYLLRITGDTKYGDSMERLLLNTVLGAKPLEADGRAFYYSDYNFHGHKTYHKDKCPCCAGTLPQVACDYHKDIYLQGVDGLIVNMYVNSTVSCSQNGVPVEVEQSTNYPLEDTVRLTVRTDSRQPLELRFRIPLWTRNAALTVNGEPVTDALTAGSFATVQRRWRHGDVVELRLPMFLRLESVDAQHPDLVALLHGPLVLFALTAEPPTVTRKQLLSARRSDSDPARWLIDIGSNEPLQMVPFTSIEDQPYTTYLRVTT